MSYCLLKEVVWAVKDLKHGMYIMDQLQYVLLVNLGVTCARLSAQTSETCFSLYLISFEFALRLTQANQLHEVFWVRHSKITRQKHGTNLNGYVSV